MAYTTINKPSDYFNTKLYTGNSSTQTISSVGFQPDFTWLKHRSGATAHMLFDSIRGALYRLQSNSSNSSVSAANTLTSWNSDGFALGTENDTNGSGRLFASWNWKANGAGSSNTDGSITSTVSANTTAGFSIVAYTGNETAGATVGHGLGSVPAMIIVKSRSVGDGWRIYHHKVSSDPETDYLVLNNSNAVADSHGYWNDTAPTSSVFSLGAAGEVNTNGSTNIAYCFTEKQGYSKFGSYVGNANADGTFVYLGFKPRFVITKRTDNTSDWVMMDSKRNPSNVMDTDLFANGSDADTTASNYSVDFLSNGWKFRGTSGGKNANGGTFIYMAFAENPFVTSTGVPCNAR